MMTVSELKEFILWCKANKVKKFNNADIQFELSDLAFLEDIDKTPMKEMVLGGSKDMLDTLKVPEGEDPDLFWSATR